MKPREEIWITSKLWPSEYGDGKSNAQIILRWHIQEGNIIFPKTTNPQHMKENFDIFDFALSDEDMTEIRKLDKGQRFFYMTLAEQEAHLSQFVPED